MARTIRIKVYEFNELNENAQQKAIESERESLIENQDLLPFFIHECTEKAESQRFFKTKFSWSLSYGQGDGLSFSGMMDIKDLAKSFNPSVKESIVRILKEYCTIEIKGNTGNYAYSSTRDVDFYIYIRTSDKKNKDNINNLVEQLKTHLEDKYITLCKELEKSGYEEIENTLSDESIKETILSNEYEFTADGRKY